MNNYSSTLHFNEVLTIFPIPSNLVCPSGYERRDGDIPGWGTNIGSRLSLTKEQCANACNDQYRCLSFEHSKTAMLCNLNKIAEPTKAENYMDYAFCMKAGLLLLTPLLLLLLLLNSRIGPKGLYS